MLEIYSILYVDVDEKQVHMHIYIYIYTYIYIVHVNPARYMYTYTYMLIENISFYFMATSFHNTLHKNLVHKISFLR